MSLEIAAMKSITEINYCFFVDYVFSPENFAVFSKNISLPSPFRLIWIVNSSKLHRKQLKNSIMEMLSMFRTMFQQVNSKSMPKLKDFQLMLCLFACSDNSNQKYGTRYGKRLFE